MSVVSVSSLNVSVAGDWRNDNVRGYRFSREAALTSGTISLSTVISFCKDSWPYMPEIADTAMHPPANILIFFIVIIMPSIIASARQSF